MLHIYNLTCRYLLTTVNMHLPRILVNSLIFNNISLILNILKHKNVDQCMIYNRINDQNSVLTNKILNDGQIKVANNKNVHKLNISLLGHQKLAIFVNSSCKDWYNIFNIVERDAFKSPFVWFIMAENITETVHILSEYRIELDSDVTLIIKQETVWNLYEIYNTGCNRNGALIVRKTGYFNNTLYLINRERRDLRGLVLNSVIVINHGIRIVNRTFERYLEEIKPDLSTIDPLHTLKFFEVLKYFRDMFNISYDFRRTNSWGYYTNGSFDGMVGALQRREADIGGSPIFVRADRAKVVDYAVETWKTRHCFIFRHPKHPGGFFTIYTRPLTAKVWYCIIGLLVLSSSILGVLLQLKYIKQAGDDQDASTSLAFLFIWSAICQQGMSISRNAMSIKVVIFVTFVYAVTLYQYYNATVVSTLLREPPKNIRTLQDLLKSDLEAGAHDILYNKDYFRYTTDPVAQQLYRKKVAFATPYNYFPPEEGIARVKKGGFAFHVDSAVAYRLMRRIFTVKELCELQEVMMFAPQNVGVGVTKRSPYKEIIAYGVRKMAESGILSRIVSVWDEPRPSCVRTPDSSIITVSIREFSTALIVLAFGYVAAIMILVVENVVWMACRNKIIEFRN